MRVLVAGLGAIARKAYLPVLTADPSLELHLATRDQAVLEEVGRVARTPFLHGSVAAALAATRFDAAFVHAATPAHPELVEQLLEQRVPTLVDKPLADDLPQVERLVALAERRETLLAVGFNRRFAPDYSELRRTDTSLLTIEKHRRRHPDTVRRVIFDDFIHVVDTLLFLAPTPPERVTIESNVANGLLSTVTLLLSGAGYIATGTMHRDSGVDEERLDAIGGGVRRSVLNMAERIVHDGAETRSRRGDWTPVARQRGFEAMCADFVDGVRQGRGTAADDILRTHRLCEAIVRHAEAARSRARG